MRGFGSDEDSILSVLGSRTQNQRQEIAEIFEQDYGKNLVEELKSELGGKFEDAIIALMSSSELYDANSLHDAMSGLGTNEAVLIEILCSRSSQEIQAIKSAFKKVHGKDLVEEIESETSGDLQSTLIKLAQGTRGNSSKKVDENRAYEDAKKLFEAGEKEKWGTNESVFVNILTNRSSRQLQATFEAYKHVATKDIMESINDELTGDFHDSIAAIVRCTRNPPLYFAEVLENALSGMSADSKDVARVVITRSEVSIIPLGQDIMY
ncbi:PREDICTED: annexin A13-like [Acropora digitifera]|uniref:annexin A13-like n=1 Tax=Acropora digitifera TaxID=70779 RepID=UPI00077A8ECE|nr:PREDICTED: annexin A13-like [Acropora digitifera]